MYVHLLLLHILLFTLFFYIFAVKPFYCYLNIYLLYLVKKYYSHSTSIIFILVNIYIVMEDKRLKSVEFITATC